MLTPIKDNVLIIMEKKPEVTAGGIVLPEFSRKQRPEEPAIGMVIAVGEDAIKREPSVIPSCIAYVKPHTGTHYVVGSTHYLVVALKHIVGVRQTINLHCSGEKQTEQCGCSNR